VVLILEQEDDSGIREQIGALRARLERETSPATARSLRKAIAALEQAAADAQKPLRERIARAIVRLAREQHIPLALPGPDPARSAAAKRRRTVDYDQVRQQILATLDGVAEGLSGRELARRLEMPYYPVHKAMMEMVREGLLVREGDHPNASRVRRA
jgi:hypothetical protein